MLVKNLVLSILLLTTNAFSMSLTAHSWLVADGDGKIIQNEKEQEQRSIASITKIMTAMVIIDAGQNPKQMIGNFTREQHIQLALVTSSNESAIALCNNYPGGKPKCIKDMNAKAIALNMPNTKFVEASGLSPMNISTALDLLKLVFEASHYPEIIRASQTPVLNIQIGNKVLSYRNTNPAIGQRYNFIVSKTGSTNAAGSCIVVMIDTDIGRRIVILLGAKAGKRLPEAEYIVFN
jgi:D-alanyl-D-alanine carboxypeptidase